MDGATCREGIRSRKFGNVDSMGEHIRVATGSRRKKTSGCAKRCIRAISGSKGSCTIDKVARLQAGHRESAHREVSKYAPSQRSQDLAVGS